MLTEGESRDLLGVSEEATHDDIIAARRRLARTAHPDSGGSHHAMVALNEACRVLLAVLASGPAESKAPPGSVSADPGAPGEPTRPHGSRGAGDRTRQGFRDTPSFVINALPVDAFEVLLVAAAHLGEVVDEEQPYLLEVLVRDPGPLWCRFELFPDAGSTTVVLSCDVEMGYRVYSVEEIRDLWISTINAMSSTA